jgi:hypothetical protein
MIFDNADKVYLGNTEVDKVYQGTNLIYEKQSGTTLTEIECYLNSNKVIKESYGNSITYVYEGEFNKTYKVKKMLSARFRCAIDSQISDTSRKIIGYVANDSGTEITISTDATRKYVYIFGWSNNDTEITADQIKSSITVEEVS